MPLSGLTTSIVAANSTDNVSSELAQGTITLGSDKTVNSWAITPFSTFVADLGGHILTLQSGGLLFGTTNGVNSPTIRNGSVTSGISGIGGELFFDTEGAIQVSASANFVDNTGGVVSLVKSGRGALSLTGNNTYSGPTYVSEGEILVNSITALPVGNVLKVNGGMVSFEVSNTASTFLLGSLELRQNGLVNDPNGGKSGINAAAYTIESGTINARLTGSGPMHKITDGTAFLALTTAEYTGTIDVDQGVLAAIVTPNALGSGLVRVHAGAYLANDILFLSNPLELAGDLSGSVSNPLANSSTSAIIFAGPITVNGAATVTTFDTLSGVTTIGSPVTISCTSTVAIQAGASLSKVAAGTLQFANVANDGTLALPSGRNSATAITGLGTTTLGLGATLSLSRIAQHSLSLGAAAKMTLVTPTSASKLDALTIDPAATLDPQLSNGLILQATDSSDKATIINYLNTSITSARSGGTWLGPGITSSTAAANPSQSAVGIFDNGILAYSNFAGGTDNADNDSILLSYALLGDANFDGHVNAADLSINQSNFDTSENNWAAGDLNGDGFVDSLDVALVVNHWDSNSPYMPLVSYSPTFSFSLVTLPEPTSMALLAMGAGLLAIRRKPRTPPITLRI